MWLPALPPKPCASWWNQSRVMNLTSPQKADLQSSGVQLRQTQRTMKVLAADDFSHNGAPCSLPHETFTAVSSAAQVFSVP